MWSCPSCTSVCASLCIRSLVRSPQRPSSAAWQVRLGDERYSRHPAAKTGNWDTSTLIFFSLLPTWLLISWSTASSRSHYLPRHQTNWVKAFKKCSKLTTPVLFRTKELQTGRFRSLWSSWSPSEAPSLSSIFGKRFDCRKHFILSRNLWHKLGVFWEQISFLIW